MGRFNNGDKIRWGKLIAILAGMFFGILFAVTAWTMLIMTLFFR